MGFSQTTCGYEDTHFQPEKRNDGAILWARRKRIIKPMNDLEKLMSTGTRENCLKALEALRHQER
jgi:hypothetical protein